MGTPLVGVVAPIAAESVPKGGTCHPTIPDYIPISGSFASPHCLDCATTPPGRLVAWTSNTGGSSSIQQTSSGEYGVSTSKGNIDKALTTILSWLGDLENDVGRGFTPNVYGFAFEKQTKKPATTNPNGL
ncbi:hypothetical protein HBH69_037480 [Parastagonospora nodorum]|nr:hypothetical protein HBH82_199350 [Parastagonospora nodorum]KAH4708345.1 hypothetical protein HBH67_061600 [Parastagonospora nodorum]KAH5161064.1 hypothetical protein HBH69_037480 [Parastagonospora nodorum]KAH6103076.1 hypothetical protein HBI65_044720 [Parastagonospora nodorum]KAH6195449.1 hypothetical protein HBI53_183340 [Parastagonospora nodorum]